MSHAPPDRWHWTAEAARVLECDRATVRRIAKAAGIRTRRLPGQPIQYLAEDVHRVASEAVHADAKPADQSATA